MFSSYRICLAIAIAFGAVNALAQTVSHRLPVRFTAFAVSTGDTVSNPVASQVEIAVDRWSTTAETARLMMVLKDKGPEALLESPCAASPIGAARLGPGPTHARQMRDPMTAFSRSS